MKNLRKLFLVELGIVSILALAGCSNPINGIEGSAADIGKAYTHKLEFKTASTSIEETWYLKLVPNDARSSRVTATWGLYKDAGCIIPVTGYGSICAVAYRDGLPHIQFYVGGVKYLIDLDYNNKFNFESYDDPEDATVYTSRESDIVYLKLNNVAYTGNVH